MTLRARAPLSRGARARLACVLDVRLALATDVEVIELAAAHPRVSPPLAEQLMRHARLMIVARQLDPAFAAELDAAVAADVRAVLSDQVGEAHVVSAIAQAQQRIRRDT